MNIRYRPEIDGLRAIFVISVLIYHAQLELFGSKMLAGGFIGVISEGDIIHSFLKGYDLHSRVSDIHNTNFIYLDESDKDNKEKIISILKKGILIIPVLDFNLNVVDVINYIEFID